MQANRSSKPLYFPNDIYDLPSNWKINKAAFNNKYLLNLGLVVVMLDRLKELKIRIKRKHFSRNKLVNIFWPLTHNYHN